MSRTWRVVCIDARPMVVLAAGIAATLFAGAGAAAREGDEALLSMQGMTYVASNGATNEVVLDAGNARIRPSEDVAHLEQVSAKLQAPDGGDGALDLTCEKGTFDLDSGDFIAEGNVRGTTADGRRFRTKKLTYVHDTGIVTSNVPVTITDAAGTYRGGGFRYYVRENRFRLMGGASVVQSQ